MSSVVVPVFSDPPSWNSAPHHPLLFRKRFCFSDTFQKRLHFSDKWIRWEIATSGHTKYWEGVPGFCESLLSAAKQCIPLGRRKNYVPCWDKECETLHRSFTRVPVGTEPDRAASSLLSGLGQKNQEWWEEAVNSIDFSHSSRKVWRIINKLTGRSGCSFRQCPVSANSIVSQLVKNGAHKTGGCESTRLVNKELFDWWKIATPEGHSISEPFRPEELAAALRHLKPGLDSIFLELRRVGSQILALWLPHFLHAPTQNSKDLEKSTNSCDP